MHGTAVKCQLLAMTRYYCSLPVAATIYIQCLSPIVLYSASSAPLTPPRPPEAADTASRIASATLLAAAVAAGAVRVAPMPPRRVAMHAEVTASVRDDTVSRRREMRRARRRRAAGSGTPLGGPLRRPGGTPGVGDAKSQSAEGQDPTADWYRWNANAPSGQHGLWTMHSNVLEALVQQAVVRGEPRSRRLPAQRPHGECRSRRRRRRARAAARHSSS